ncbi:hypothetical protein BV25DRAFT_1831294 [Artomyces pyxidatus]|uniref:Uncharacterized protein n=1 Tax=Artomyces pyxidatus TaxID=48021 RepID=A0ACB8SN55_9AGAM|nr:hypothetical protein BV25DRAFT_1831294 [Artomyces pyxidatus]
MMGVQQDPDRPEEALAPYFEKSATTVRQTFERFEDDYARPVVKSGAAAFAAYPITTTFFFIFAALSFLPVLTFFVFTAFTLASALTIGLFIAFAFSTFVFIFSGGVLLGILAITLLLSSILTVLALSTYLFARLLRLVSVSGRNGVLEWANETKQTFMPSRAPKVEEDAYASDESGVIIKREGEEDGVVRTADEGYRIDHSEADVKESSG